MHGFPAQDYTINKLWPVAQRKGLVGFCSLQLRRLAQQHGTTTACGWQSRLWLAQQHGTTTACGWQSRLWLTGQQPPVAGRAACGWPSSTGQQPPVAGRAACGSRDNNRLWLAGVRFPSQRACTSAPTATAGDNNAVITVSLARTATAGLLAVIRLTEGIEVSAVLASPVDEPRPQRQSAGVLVTRRGGAGSQRWLRRI